MIDKKEFLLQSIIKAYIEHCEPIGSTQLKSMYDIRYSPATIRGYFKKLGDEGFLAQEHVSSGRTPTREALKQYWTSRLDFSLANVDSKAIQHLASKIGLSVFVLKDKSDTLIELINISDKYMVLEFTSFAITVKYSDPLFRFLKDMISIDIKGILKISQQVGALEVYDAVNQHLENRDFHIYNIKEFMSLALQYDYDELIINKFLKGKILEGLEEGLYFSGLIPEGYIAICHDCRIDGKQSKMFVVGELSKDYEYFYEEISII
ncbi:MAG: heat-shock protein [Campylobacteraceae bacterium]|nr:heat-shock protein [Campylobacteraceae bacterium]